MLGRKKNPKVATANQENFPPLKGGFEGKNYSDAVCKGPGPAVAVPSTQHPASCSKKGGAAGLESATGAPLAASGAAATSNAVTSKPMQTNTALPANPKNAPMKSVAKQINAHPSTGANTGSRKAGSQPLLAEPFTPSSFNHQSLDGHAVSGGSSTIRGNELLSVSAAAIVVGADHAHAEQWQQVKHKKKKKAHYLPTEDSGPAG